MRGTELTTTTKRRHRYFLRRCRLFRSLFVWSSFVFVYRGGGGGGGGGGGIIAKQSHKRHYYREISSSSSSNFFVSKIKKMSRLFILFGLRSI